MRVSQKISELKPHVDAAGLLIFDRDIGEPLSHQVFRRLESLLTCRLLNPERRSAGSADLALTIKAMSARSCGNTERDRTHEKPHQGRASSLDMQERHAHSSAGRSVAGAVPASTGLCAKASCRIA
jgi:hypothetical protein